MGLAFQQKARDGFLALATQHARFRVIDADFTGQYAPIHDHFLSHRRTSRRFDASALEAELWPVLRWNGSAYARIERPER